MSLGLLGKKPLNNLLAKFRALVIRVWTTAPAPYHQGGALAEKAL